jgi:predicted transcriptional regulator
MKLEEIRKILGAVVIVGKEEMEKEVNCACSSDLMSDVLAFAKPGALLLTGLTNIQSVRTAEIADIKAIVYVRGKQPDEAAVKLAKEKKIPLLSTPLRMFEACGRLYMAGLRGVGEVEEKVAANK